MSSLVSDSEREGALADGSTVLSPPVGGAVPRSSEPARRHLSPRRALTVQALAEATVEVVREGGYDGLTVRGVARRAGVAPATAYTYFGSREHLVTEVFWRRLQALPETRLDRRRSTTRLVSETLGDLALLVADEPELAAACSAAMLSSDPDVRTLRDRIGSEMRRRVARALGPDATPSLLDTFDLLITGALIHAGTGHLTYHDLPERLARSAETLIRGAS